MGKVDVKRREVNDNHKPISFAFLLSVYIAVASLAVLILFSIILSSSFEKATLNISRIVKQDFLKVKKNQIRYDVFKLIREIHFRDMHSHRRMRKVIYWSLNKALSVAKNLYDTYKLMFSVQAGKSIAIKFLEENTFHMGDGAFAVVASNGAVLNGNRIRFSDRTRSRFVSYARNSKNGFYINGKTASGRQFVGYARYFSPIRMFVMSFVYTEPFVKRIQRQTIMSLFKSSFGINVDQYVFIYTLDGDVLLEAGNVYRRTHPKLWHIGNLSRCKPESVFKRILSACNMGGGFLEYKWVEPSSGKLAWKISYVALYKPWGWIVGEGFYVNRAESIASYISTQLRSALNRVAEDAWIVAFFVLAVVFAASGFIFWLTRRTVRGLLDQMNMAFEKGVRIDQERYLTGEVRDIVGYINRALERFDQYENEFLEAFVRAIEARDSYTRGHSQRVAAYSQRMAQRLGYDEVKQREIYRAGLVHDIGKLGIPDSILLKPGRLTGNEYRIIKYHPIFSYEIVSRVSRFKGIAGIVRHHHERCDGSGYPDGLLCDEIEFEARILAIADVFDALTTKRIYRGALTPDEAIELMEQEPLDQDIIRQCRDVLKHAYKELERQADYGGMAEVERIRKELYEVDYRTGLKRREYVIAKAAELAESGKRFAMFMVDIKDLGIINLEFPFEVGDKLISFTAIALESTIRQLGLDSTYLARAKEDAFLFIVELTEERENRLAELADEIRSELKRRVKGMFVESEIRYITEDNRGIEEFIDYHVLYCIFPNDADDPLRMPHVCSLKKMLKGLYLNVESSRKK